MLNLTRFNCPVPRYTSYPTAPHWTPCDDSELVQTLQSMDDKPISLYIHIPFCHSMCLFCGCSVILNRDPEKERRYVSFLLKEIALLTSHITGRKKVSQLHFGGGTPTKLDFSLLEKVMQHLREKFDLCGEIAIEIDPRTATEEKLLHLKKMGFNRVSFGVQDLNENVQEAIKRRQSEAMTRQVYGEARVCGFEEINFDLIYGLPKQTEESFQKTMDVIVELQPDRLALFSYAKVPWLKPHQRAISDADLPTLEQKFAIYAEARKRLVESGYVAIGMDHFAKETSDLAKSYHAKTLSRNFQGYTVKSSDILLGLGVTAIGYTPQGYFQNAKDLKAYETAISDNRLPICRGKKLSLDDRIRKWTIEKVMCRFEVDKEEFFKTWGHSFDSYFKEIHFPCDLVVNDKNIFKVKPEGELFVRNVAHAFDAYAETKVTGFSSSI